MTTLYSNNNEGCKLEILFVKKAVAILIQDLSLPSQMAVIQEWRSALLSAFSCNSYVAPRTTNTVSSPSMSSTSVIPAKASETGTPSCDSQDRAHRERRTQSLTKIRELIPPHGLACNALHGFISRVHASPSSLNTSLNGQ